MSSPLISIYMPTHNRPALLARAIASVRSQDYGNWELVIVNDCSTRSTDELLESIVDARIKVIRNAVPMGACISRNIAIIAASGHFVTGLDDDDYFHPNRLTGFHTAWRGLVESGLDFGFLYDDASVIAANGITSVRKFVDVSGLTHLNGYNSVGSQVFCRRSDIISAGLFSPSMPAWQDWEMWIRLARKAGSGINIKLATYVVDESHDHERISQKPPHVLRFAAKQLFHRNKNFTAAERASVTYTLCNYPQVKRTLFDYVQMAPLMASKALFWDKLSRKLSRSTS